MPLHSWLTGVSVDQHTISSPLYPGVNKNALSALCRYEQREPRVFIPVEGTWAMRRVTRHNSWSPPHPATKPAAISLKSKRPLMISKSRIRPRVTRTAEYTCAPKIEYKERKLGRGSASFVSPRAHIAGSCTKSKSWKHVRAQSDLAPPYRSDRTARPRGRIQDARAAAARGRRRFDRSRLKWLGGRASSQGCSSFSFPNTYM